MATILLSAAGAAAGALLGPIGAIGGRALGALAGAMIDRALIRSTLPNQTKGPRLTDLSVQTSTEGEDIARAYGRVRLSGQVFWATHYEEQTVRSQAGGKGGPTVQSYDYYANFAVGLCEGPINRVARVWADGVELDLSAVQMRVYEGSEDQLPDALIEAVQPGAVPAYRGLAYVVFERLALADYGNRLPQLAFEVIRVVDTLESRIRAITLIPGATEFGLATTAATSRNSSGSTVSENRHVTSAPTDIAAALDELQALCPALERIALVVAWFGDDLRAGHCTLAPRVVSNTRAVTLSWSVAGLDRTAARHVSYVTPALSYGTSTTATIAAYGGTPDDASVVAAIRAINARGLKVTLYPFILMDIPPGNTLPDPYGGTAQAAFPWRGRITVSPAPGMAGSPDRSAAAAADIATFVGSCRAADFAVSGTAVVYSGATEWSFRRMLLHYASLAKAAGGVDAFLLGSELRGLTTSRSASATYSFVDALVALAGDVKSILGSSTKVSYGADWSEWFGHHPADGSGDVYFHLDSLWASPNVDFIGIDCYVPLADWRYGNHLDATVAETAWDIDYLRTRVQSGEGYDWYYASSAHRSAQVRTAITDGAYSEPWIWRFKDLAGWWQSPHYNRPGGVRASSPTIWVPRSKPIWLTEAGCPAVDLGANQPNMFPDANSSEAGLPYFSRGARDDLMQRRYCEAMLSAWDPADPDHVPAATLVTTSGARIVDPATIHLWTWDARPFPAFPALADVWADGANWATGHWLSGRLGGTSVEALIRAILADCGFTAVDAQAVGGHVDGYLIDSNMSARAALEPLLTAWQIDAIDTGTTIRFAGRSRRVATTIGDDDLVDPGNAEVVEVKRTEETDLPHEVSVTVSDALRDHRRSTVTSRRLSGYSQRATRADLPVVAPLDVTLGIADEWLHDLWIGRESVNFSVAVSMAGLEPGDIVTVSTGGADRTVLIEKITDGAERAIAARSIDPSLYGPVPVAVRSVNAAAAVAYGRPTVHVLDIAHATDSDPVHRPYLAVSADPWPGSVSVWRQASGGGSFSLVASADKRATLGLTTTAVVPGAVSRWDYTQAIGVEIFAGTLSSANEADVLGGANLAAVQNLAGVWEVFQFADATLTNPQTYRLSKLLRVQGGSDDAWNAAIPAGSPFVLLDDALVSLPIAQNDIGRALAFKVGPARDAYTATSYADVAVTPGGRGLMPWSPTDIRARRDAASGDITFSWIRRSRAPGADVWSAGDVPLGEESEAYRLEILSSGAAIRRFDVSSPACTYAAADQMTDFGSLQGTYAINVAELSALLGPGIQRAATVTL
ncbi:MAG: glycoside hydrolase/phage tail family protein [Ancalomicrobiaceae bacterium]|nr:glycoside hydrolase/phage tail family protein [Ancalomicrobiaceae bacterium]